MDSNITRPSLDSILGPKTQGAKPSLDSILAPKEQVAPPSQNQGIIGRLSDIYLGPKIAGGLVKGLAGQTLKTLVQLPQSFQGGVLGLAEAAGVEGAGQLRERVMQPKTVPVLGEVQPLSAVPSDVERFEAATPKQALGQAIGMLPEAVLVGAFTLPFARAIPQTALGKLAQSFGVGAQFGTLTGGSQALLQDKEMPEVLGEAVKTGLISGTISAGLSALTMIPSGELKNVPKDISNLYKQSKQFAVEKMKSLMPYTTGIKAVDVKAMSNPEIAPRMIERLKILEEGRQTGNSLLAEDNLKVSNYNKMRMIYDRAKEKAESAYGAARDRIEKVYGAKTVGGKNVLENTAKKSVDLSQGYVEKGVDNVSPVVVIAGERDGSEVLTAMYRRIQKSGGNPNVSELFKLKRDLGELYNRLDQGTASYRSGSFMLDAIDSELNRLTGGASKPMNAAYSAFKKAQWNVSPLWKNLKDDTRYNFGRLLENQSKTGSRDALVELEKIAGFDGFVRKELEASRLSRQLIKDTGFTGSRKLDDVIRTLFVSSPAAIGGAVGSVFGPVGAGAGASIGLNIGGFTLKTLQSPQFWMPYIMNQFKQKGIEVTAQQAQNLVASPLFQQTLQTILKAKKSE